MNINDRNLFYRKIRKRFRDGEKVIEHKNDKTMFNNVKRLILSKAAATAGSYDPPRRWATR